VPRDEWILDAGYTLKIEPSSVQTLTTVVGHGRNLCDDID
jgi:hypothetical protein